MSGADYNPADSGNDDGQEAGDYHMGGDEAEKDIANVPTWGRKISRTTQRYRTSIQSRILRTTSSDSVALMSWNHKSEIGTETRHVIRSGLPLQALMAVSMGTPLFMELFIMITEMHEEDQTNGP